MKTDLYQQVTDRLIAALEAGASPWRRGWDDSTDSALGGMPPLPRRATGEFYRGINILLLWGAAIDKGYRCDRWFTFNQAKALGAAVRKGEKATPVVFFKKLEITEKNDAGQDEEKSIPMMRQYFVFNAEQIDGLPDRYYLAPALPATPADAKKRDEISEAALRSCGAEIREGELKAYYAPGADFVMMPPFARFHTTGGYLRTLAHELCHWTGHASRLDRKQLNAFGSKDYAFEELVAEIGSAFAGARLGIIGENIESHASYIDAWLAALKNDKRFVFKAAAAAQAAADMVLAKAEALPDFDAIEAEPTEPAPAPAPAQAELAPLLL